MKLPHVLLVIVLSFVVAFVTVRLVRTSNGGVSPAIVRESAYERIMRRGEIHCGYSSWNPLFFIDSVTGEKKGIFHDAMEEIGKRLGLKIIWQEELGWGSVIEAVRTGRVDMACSGYYLNPPRIKNLSSTLAQLYTPLYVFVRQNDNRHYNSLDDLNSAQMTVASIDGSGENQTVARRFARAKSLPLPELDTSADEVQSLLTNKADFIVLDSATAKSYMASNPNKIRNLFPGQPIIDFPNVILLPPNELRLKEMIDDMLLNIEYDGVLDEILKRYNAESSLQRNVKPVEP